MEINLVAILVAAVAAFFIGFLWYTFLFQKPWMKELGFKSEKEMNSNPNMGKLLLGSFVLEVLMAFGLSLLIEADTSVSAGAVTGSIAGLFISGFALGNNYLFEGKTLTLWLINAGYVTVIFTAMGAILALLA
ncbi:DUF1761 domain-containing protein [Candidatus Dojkabacteria bacterium]|uniref:DUF1761 domain-containing protein n=1 Tax=Candidatus Dojkabacteria bacterium TaxID=2099670 RepID=A0A955L136_9BACT|nr:DUF1761 domain-containing protein [Candidatus Dojkabacteria bacterium]